MIQTKAKLVYNKRIKDNYSHCAFYAPLAARKAGPGQFVNIKVSEDGIPLLRRPFSIHRVKGPNIEILYEVLGRGTQILSQKKTGEYLDIIGPLGNGFVYSLAFTLPAGEAGAYRLPILVAGGMGVVPLIFLAEKLAERRAQSARRKAQVLIGAKTGKQILCENEFKKLGCEVKIATDDGSRGYKGKVTELLKFLLLTIDYRPSTIYACGPRPMLSEISRISERYGIPAQISLEEHMACGIGACLGCAVETRQGYKRVCKEGPVFEASQIIWGKE